MGTTLTALLVRGHTGVMGHVGDSRLYLLREGQLHQLSDDHTVGAELLRRGAFTREDHQQSGYGHALTRAVGIQPSVHVDTLVLDILPEDTLLLCSDGLTREIPDAAELTTFLGDEDAAGISTGLVDLARHRGGHDNITAVVVRSAPEPMLAADDRERLTEVRLRLDTLRYVWLFQHLTLKELVQVMDSFRPEACEAGEAVLREGEAGSALFVVLEGHLRVHRGQLELGKLETGSHFGEMSLLNGRPRSATVVAETPARLLKMERKAFVALMRQDARLAAKLLWTLSQVLSLRLDETSEHALACGVGSVDEVPSPLWK
jgi:hypothetical protein